MPSWYNLIAGIYDQFSKRTYRDARLALVQTLDIQPGDKVLFVGCGTGLSFGFVQEKVGSSGLIVGLDFSKNMLAQAQKKISEHGWSNVSLIHADGRHLSENLIKQHMGQDILFDHVIGELAFSVMSDWQFIMRKALKILKKGGKFGVLDGYRPKKDFLNALLNALPRSDISRPISTYLSELTHNYTLQTFGKTEIIFIGVGTRPEN